MRKYILWLLMAVLLLTLTPSVAAEPGPTPITTVEELQNMDPDGMYILMNDLDLAGVQWKPLELRGSFDGNGHTILNLNLTQVADGYGMTFDGNLKKYETRFSALFGFVSGNIRNLNLLNVRGLVETDEPCFLAGIAGYLDGGTVSDCTVTGNLELRAHDRCFGVGGVMGFGSGTVENCTADVTLICTDTQKEADEQFMGGICAAGLVDIKGCTVNIDGYVSEHGYAHNGGVIGMLVRYSGSNAGVGAVIDNHVTGKITFFEEVSSRRAYCKAIIGESLVYDMPERGNTSDFTRDERYDYNTELRPDMCQSPVYRQESVAGTCPEYGYTVCTCEACGYTYRDRYTLPQHTKDSWFTVTQSNALAQQHCTGCGTMLSQELPGQPLPDAPQIQPTEPAAPAPTPTEPTDNTWLWFAAAGVALCTVVILIILLRSGKKQRKRP